MFISYEDLTEKLRKPEWRLKHTSSLGNILYFAINEEERIIVLVAYCKAIRCVTNGVEVAN